MATINQRVETHLNQTYASCYSEEEAVDAFIYLTSKTRTGGRTTEKNIRNCHRNHTLGTLLRRYDSVAFECNKSDLNFR